MGEDEDVHERRMFRWSIEARELVREYKGRVPRNLMQIGPEQRLLVGRLAEVSGNPRDACLRFLLQSGVRHKRAYREWTKREQQRLADLVMTMAVDEAAKALGRPLVSVRSDVASPGSWRYQAPGLVYQIFLVASAARAS